MQKQYAPRVTYTDVCMQNLKKEKAWVGSLIRAFVTKPPKDE